MMVNIELLQEVTPEVNAWLAIPCSAGHSRPMTPLRHVILFRETGKKQQQQQGRAT